MLVAPVDIPRRPFAIEPITSIMLPDGIFDTAIFELNITCRLVNTGPDVLSGSTIYVEGIDDPSIYVDLQTHVIPSLTPGASCQIHWAANFRNASAGKKRISFIAKLQGCEPKRMIKTIFVTRTSFDRMHEVFRCEADGGAMELAIHSVIGSARRGQADPEDPKSPYESGPWIPTRFSMKLVPTIPYRGQYGPLAFDDPWWKVVAWIVAIVCGIAAAVAAALGKGKASIQVDGEFGSSDPNLKICNPTPTASAKEYFTVAGVLSAITAGAIRVGCADEQDPFRRGQEITPPESPSELTLGEDVTVDFEFGLDQPTGAGLGMPSSGPYKMGVKWIYRRQTDKKIYTSTLVSEIQQNTDFVHSLNVDTPAEVVLRTDQFYINASLSKSGGALYAGDELYVFALLRSPGVDGDAFLVLLEDNGLGRDPAAGDGIFSGIFDLLRAAGQLSERHKPVFGEWQVFIFAQNINPLRGDSPLSPEQAAAYIGGSVVRSPLSRILEAGKCEQRSKADKIVPVKK
ncbi:MAG TPA: hypothetical protein VJZ71_16550 [Phycisphaerae bacterium]|nr:hypothetical protein [Phycisphaerae bacterium]